MQYTYEHNGDTHSIKLEKQPDGLFLAVIGEEKYTVSIVQMPDNGWLLHIDGKRYVTHTASEKEMRFVHLEGVQYQLEKSVGRRRKSSSSSTPGSLKAEMPGQVIDVRVVLGDTVTEGQVLVVLEAMKMEIRLTTPYDGIVAKLLVSQGDVVDRGQLLVEVTQE
jgi:biotin carboxyl carrier protein